MVSLYHIYSVLLTNSLFNMLFLWAMQRDVFGSNLSKFRDKNLKASLMSSTHALFSDKARCFSQSEHALYGNFIINLTNRFHVPVRLFSYRSQMTSKCGRNKKVAHKAIAACITDVLTTFWPHLWSITEQTHSNMESICFITIITKSFFNFKYFSITWKPGFALPLPTLVNKKKAIWRNLLSIQNEVISLAAIHSKELWLVQENHASFKPGSSSLSISPHGIKTYCESRIELRNLQI